MAARLAVSSGAAVRRAARSRAGTSSAALLRAAMPAPPTFTAQAVVVRADTRGALGHVRWPPARSARLFASSVPDGPHRQQCEAAIDVLYDGECPLCMHEINWLSKRNKNRGNVSMVFTDISRPDYDPSVHAGVTYEEGMKVMHVVKDGQVYKGVESFKIMYEAVGLGFVVRGLASPSLKMAADRVYDVWARLRLPMSGRPSLEVLLARRSAEEATCKTARSQGCK